MARSGNAMAGMGGGLGKFTELRQRLLFVLGALIVYRIGCYIPVPGVNPDAMLQLMETQQGTIVDMFNMFSGGALERFSLFALNVMPYISASIIVQLLVQMVPSLKAIQKEGESGRKRINQWSRLGAIPLAILPRSCCTSSTSWTPVTSTSPRCAPRSWCRAPPSAPRSSRRAS